MILHRDDEHGARAKPGREVERIVCRYGAPFGSAYASSRTRGSPCTATQPARLSSFTFTVRSENANETASFCASLNAAAGLAARPPPDRGCPPRDPRIAAIRSGSSRGASRVTLGGRGGPDPVQGSDPFLGLPKAFLRRETWSGAVGPLRAAPARRPGDGRAWAEGDDEPAAALAFLALGVDHSACARTIARAMTRPMPSPPKQRLEDVSFCRSGRTRAAGTRVDAVASSSTEVSFPARGQAPGHAHASPRTART